MTKLIGIKELQTNTKKIREETANGTRFIVVYRSTPVFEITPIENKIDFSDTLSSSGLYSKKFLSRMKNAEKDIKNGKIKTFNSTEDFFKTLG